jgi:signal transduction histidine kinase
LKLSLSSSIFSQNNDKITYKLKEFPLSVAIVSLEESGALNVIFNNIPDLVLEALENVDTFLSQNPKYVKMNLTDSETSSLFLLIKGDQLFVGAQKKINENVHEIKNVLTVVISSVLILLKIKNKGLLSEKADLLERSLKDIEVAVHSVNTLLNSLKEINKDSGKEYKIRVKDFLSSATSELKSVTENSDIDLVLNIDVNQEDAFVLTHGILLNQIVVNLFKNAVYAISKPGQINPKLVVDIKEVGDMITFMIKDNGEGIDEDKKSFIFKSGFTTKGKDGSGVGLYLCKKGVERSGGSLQLLPSDGAGACFYFELPLSK